MYSGSSTGDPTVPHVLPLMVHVPVHATTATTTTAPNNATCTCDIGGPAGFRSRLKRLQVPPPTQKFFLKELFSSRWLSNIKRIFGFIFEHAAEPTFCQRNTR